MRLLGESSQAEMVAEFLRAEYESSMLDHVRQLVAMNYLPQRFITHPDTSNPSENKAREGALRAYRGNFFRGFPATQVRWFHAAIDRADLEVALNCYPNCQPFHRTGVAIGAAEFASS